MSLLTEVKSEQMLPNLCETRHQVDYKSIGGRGNALFVVAWHGPLALRDHGVYRLRDLWSRLGDVLQGQVFERAGVLDIG